MIKNVVVGFAAFTCFFLAHSASASALWPHTAFTDNNVPVHMVVEKGFVGDGEVHDKRDLWFSVFVAGDQRNNEGSIKVSLVPSGTTDCDLAGTGIYAKVYHAGLPSGENIPNCGATKDISFQKNWDNGYRRYYSDRGVVGQGVTEYVIHVQLVLPGSYNDTNSKGFAFYANNPENPEVAFGVTAGMELSLMADKAQGHFTNMFVTQQGPCTAVTGGNVFGYDYDNWGANRAQNNTADNWVPMYASWRNAASGSDTYAVGGVPWVPTEGTLLSPRSGSQGTDVLNVAAYPYNKYQFVLHSIGRNNFITLTMPFNGDPFTCVAPVTTKVTPHSYINNIEADSSIDASSGAPKVKHVLAVTRVGNQPTSITYKIETYASTVNNCSSGGSWVSEGENTMAIGGDIAVWDSPISDARWDRNTTEYICQRLRITGSSGIELGATESMRSYDVRGGDIVVYANSDPLITEAEPLTAFTLSGWLDASTHNGNSYDLTYKIRYWNEGATGISGLPSDKSGTVTITSVVKARVDRNDFSVTIPDSAVPGSKICVETSVSNPTEDRYFSAILHSTKHCVIVIYKPIFSITGGDVSAGAAYRTAGVCGGAYDHAKIGGWNTNVSPYDKGAGVQLAALSTGSIVGFATARQAAGVAPPRGLAFSNSPGTYSGEAYGGDYDEAVPCISDYWGVVPSTTTDITAAQINTSPTGNYKLVGGNTIGNISIPAGKQLIIYVTGDLVINNNITYQGRGTWGSLSSIPGLKIIVYGKIIINRNVSQLDGVYAAGTTIQTCDVPTTDTANFYTQCNLPLTVNGALVARGHVLLLRTFGTSKKGNIAEQINFLPEVWLARWPSLTNTATSAGRYDAITALPPVL